MRAGAALLALTAPLLLGQAKPVLVPDVSQRDIEIVYSFTGADLLLFGAIVYPGGEAPAPGDRPADIVVVLKGPVQSVLVREKEKVAGIWVNADRMRYRSAPSFYAIASSRPIRELVDDRTRAIFELGLDSLQLSPASGAAPAVQARFDAGLVDLRRRGGLFYEAQGAVEITGGVLYRARLGIPARVPVGRYTRRDLPDPRRARARRGGAPGRDPQVRVRALRRARRRALLDSLRPDGSGAVGAARLGGGRDLAKVLRACLRMRLSAHCGAGPLPHPATQCQYPMGGRVGGGPAPPRNALFRAFPNGLRAVSSFAEAAGATV